MYLNTQLWNSALVIITLLFLSLCNQCLQGNTIMCHVRWQKQSCYFPSNFPLCFLLARLLVVLCGTLASLTAFAVSVDLLYSYSSQLPDCSSEILLFYVTKKMFSPDVVFICVCECTTCNISDTPGWWLRLGLRSNREEYFQFSFQHVVRG